MPVRRAALVLLLLASCRTHDVAPAIPAPTRQGPSQSVAEAKRDGVPADVAAMPLDQRTKLDVVDSPSVTTDEGVWALARPKPGYGEVLLLNERRTQIVKAFPLPDTSPIYLAVSDSAVYCASEQGDITVCRIDRRSRVMTHRYFTSRSLEIDEFTATDSAVWAKDVHGRWTKLNPTTLEIVARGLAKPT